jgi:Protein phosphatase 2C
MERAQASWRVMGASTAGTGHRRTGRGCDDCNLSQTLLDGTLLIGVADGAGSASHASEGASLAASIALATVTEVLEQRGEPPNPVGWQAVLGGAFQAARVALCARAAQPSVAPIPASAPESGDEGPFVEETPPPTASTLPVREYATTLLIAVVTSSSLAVAQLGDGAVVVRLEDGSLRAVTWPDHGEYVNETAFITDTDYLRRMQFAYVPDVGSISGIATFTDGLQMLALDMARREPHPPFFQPLFAFAQSTDASESELQAFLDSERVCARTEDDKTLVLAVHS